VPEGQKLALAFLRHASGQWLTFRGQAFPPGTPPFNLDEVGGRSQNPARSSCCLQRLLPDHVAGASCGEPSIRRLFGLIAAAALLAASSGSTAAQGIGAEEAAIKKVVETMVRAANKDEFNVMLAQFSDDAKIDSRAAGGQVSKARYAEIMREVYKRGDVISADVRDLVIAMPDASHATVLGTVYLQTRTSRPSARVEYKLEKRADRWLIVETRRK
jgi:hypothetical protein